MKLTKSEILQQISHIQRYGTKLVVNGVIVYSHQNNQVAFNPKTKKFELTYNRDVYSS